MRRSTGVAFGSANLLHRAPGAAIGGEDARINLRLVVAVKIAPRQIDPVVISHGEGCVERFGSRIGLNQLTRSHALAFVFGHVVINACLLLRAPEGEPADVELTATVTPDARARVRTGRDLPAVVIDLHRRAEALSTVS